MSGPATLVELLDHIAAPDRPADPAFLHRQGGTAVTREAFARRVRSSAGAFTRIGLEPGATIAFGVRQDVAGIAWLLGALRAGLTVVIVNPGLAPDHLVAQCRLAAVDAVVLDGGVAAVARHPVLRAIAARRGLRLPAPSRLARAIWATSASFSLAPRLDRRAGGDGRRPVHPGLPAVVLFTSGTTDRPRGVVHTGASLAATMAMATDAWALGAGDRVLGAGLHLVAPALLAGSPVVLAPARGNDESLSRVTRDAGVTHVSLPLHRALRWAAAGGASPALRSVVLGSAPVRNAALAQLRARLPADVSLTSVYGLTEHLLVARVDAAERLAHDERAGDLVGTPFAGVGVRVAGDGEIWLSGPALARGYLGDGVPGSEAGAARAPAHDSSAPAHDSEAPAAELPTGDVGRLDEAGRLVLLGRRKEMLIRDGVNVYPTLYEAPLAEAAALEAAFLVGVADATGNEAVVLVGVPRSGDDPLAARARVQAVIRGPSSPLDAHARPDAITMVPAVPRAGRSGKPDRAALAGLAAGALTGDRGNTRRDTASRADR